MSPLREAHQESLLDPDTIIITCSLPHCPVEQHPDENRQPDNGTLVEITSESMAESALLLAASHLKYHQGYIGDDPTVTIYHYADKTAHKNHPAGSLYNDEAIQQALS